MSKKKKKMQTGNVTPLPRNLRASAFSKSIVLSIFLNLLLCALYCAALLQLLTGIDRETMFSTSDSLTYLNVGNWLFDRTPTDDTLIRPFFFPLLLRSALGVFGIRGTWFLQFLFWAASINFLFFAVRKQTESILASFSSALLMASNLSYLALTLHALSDVLSTLLLSILVWLLVRRRGSLRDAGLHRGLLIVSVLSAVVKPQYLGFVIILLFLVFLLLDLGHYLRKPQNILVLVLILVPLFFQVGIMKAKHDRWSISGIGSITFKDYFFAQGYAETTGIGIQEARERIKKFTSSDMREFLRRHRAIYLRNFFGNIAHNIDAHPTFLAYPENKKHHAFFRLMQHVNRAYLYAHFAFFFLIMLDAILLWVKRSRDELALIAVLSFVLYFILLTVGISFWQGDRLVLPSLPVWITLYTTTIFHLKKHFFEYFEVSW